MEALKVEKWLKFDSGSGYGSGDGDGSGYGSGDGDGYGYGYGDGSGSGYGYGSGYGDGSGSGYGYGSGSGYGSGDGIKEFNNMKVYTIDSVQTIITKLKGNLAKGFFLQNDLTLMPCFIVKWQGYFAHGATVREAREALQCKILRNMDTDYAIDKFLEKFKKGRKYSVKDFFEWHYILTGSCEQGRLAFMAEHDLSFDDNLTVSEFIVLTRRSYGGEIIQRLKERIDSFEH